MKKSLLVILRRFRVCVFTASQIICPLESFRSYPGASSHENAHISSVVEEDLHHPLIGVLWRGSMGGRAARDSSLQWLSTSRDFPDGLTVDRICEGR
jgi:hypothetical protein